MYRGADGERTQQAARTLVRVVDGQHRQEAVLGQELNHRQHRHQVGRDVSLRKHDALGAPHRAGCEHDDRDRIWVEPREGIAPYLARLAGDELLHRVDAPRPLREVHVHEDLEPLDRRRDGEHGVAHPLREHHSLRVRRVEDGDDLVLLEALVDRDHHEVERRRSEVGNRPLHAVLGDHRHVVALLEPDLAERPSEPDRAVHQLLERQPADRRFVEVFECQFRPMALRRPAQKILQ